MFTVCGNRFLLVIVHPEVFAMLDRVLYVVVLVCTILFHRFRTEEDGTTNVFINTRCVYKQPVLED